MSSNGSALKYITICKHCSQRFSNSALPIIGENPDEKTIQFVRALEKHFRDKHPEKAMQAALFYYQFIGWYTMNQFETSDPNLSASQESARAWLSKLARKNRLSDAEIVDKIVSQEPLTAEKAIEVVKEVRDFEEERGRYALPTTA